MMPDKEIDQDWEAYYNQHDTAKTREETEKCLAELFVWQADANSEDRRKVQRAIKSFVSELNSPAFCALASGWGYAIIPRFAET